MTKPKIAADPLRARYLEALDLLERVHHQMIIVVKDELDRRNEGTINWAQAILLYKVGEREVTASQLCEQGQYLGSNVSYNLVKLTNAGYIHREPSEMDRRSIRVRLTEKGMGISNMVEMLFNRHLSSLEAVAGVGVSELSAANTILEQLERCRIQMQFRPRNQPTKTTFDAWAGAD